MEQHISQMMSAGFEPEKLAVQHVGNRGQRIPVPDLAMGKSVGHPGEGQALGDFRILKDINVIVVIDELEPNGAAEDDPDKSGKEDADAADQPFGSVGGVCLEVWAFGVVWHWGFRRQICRPKRPRAIPVLMDHRTLPA